MGSDTGGRAVALGIAVACVGFLLAADNSGSWPFLVSAMGLGLSAGLLLRSVSPSGVALGLFVGAFGPFQVLLDGFGDGTLAWLWPNWVLVAGLVGAAVAHVLRRAKGTSIPFAIALLLAASGAAGWISIDIGQQDWSMVIVDLLELAGFALAAAGTWKSRVVARDVAGSSS